MAERYLKRATTVAAGKAGEERARGVGVEVGPAEDWVALMKLYSERWPPSARAADALVRRYPKRNEKSSNEYIGAWCAIFVNVFLMTEGKPNLSYAKACGNTLGDIDVRHHPSR